MTPRRSKSGPSAEKPAQEAPPQSVEEALSRARQHGQRALAEALRAARALLDAASLAASGAPSDAHATLGRLTKSLDELANGLASSPGDATHQLVSAILDALDQEIGRWEKRSRDDGDARAVLRAFLGLREILWEFGLRRADSEASSPKAERRARRVDPRPQRDASAPRPRVQRVKVEG